ncbi:MAG: peptidoglycan DD-metalloendopeptidase family protein [Flavobacteriales bacterium]
MEKTIWKKLSAILLICPLLGAAQVESAPELMTDTLAWENYEPHMGGASEEEAQQTGLYFEPSITLELNSVADSLANIPAYDLYCGWDTKTLFADKTAQQYVGDGMKFILCHNECDFVYPTNGEITSPFGPRWGRIHYGLDIDLETGDNVVSAFEGLVRISQYHESYGNVVVVRHNNGLETLYAHLSQRKVKPGDHLEAGQLLGLGGNTGRSYGAHLHFEIRFMGEAIDPNLIVDPSKKTLRDWEFELEKEHFNYISKAVDQKAIQARKGSSKQVKYHTVKSGDTLSAIARKRGTSVDAICKLNKIKKTTTLRPGQKLKYH